MSNTPPPEVQAAAKVVDAWLNKVEGRKSPDEIAKMSAAERLNYVRNFDQSKMPTWKDPRT